MANAATKNAKSKARRPFLIRLGKKLRNGGNWIAGWQSLIPTDPVLSHEHFEWTAGLASEWQTIAMEARQILNHREAIPPLNKISPDHARIAADGRWRSFFLIGYGHAIAENCARAPQTARLVRSIPGLNSAFFSILDAGAVIPRHRGVTRGIVTCHLALDVPDQPERCTIQVTDQTLHWRAGKWLIFDDSYPHEVANETSQQRVILLIQVKRPMRFFGRMLNSLALWAIRKSAFVQDALKRLDRWEEAFSKAENNSKK